MRDINKCNRLQKLGLRPAADAYCEEVRLRMASERGGVKRNREEVKQAADNLMWDVFEPIVKRQETQAAEMIDAKKNQPTPEPPAPQLIGLPDLTDDLLDPDYAESDPGKQLRDGLLWVVAEWMRVVKDTPEGPVANIQAASKPPPNAFTLLVLSTYALSGIDKRRELITRALAFATKSHEVEPGSRNNEPQVSGFLESIE